MLTVGNLENIHTQKKQSTHPEEPIVNGSPNLFYK